ncbi:MAG: hypothetical protein M3Q99_15465 [Acidobacteriota bacterium]|nr:hypothetical protein [Acidobacteriota bacterium]
MSNSETLKILDTIQGSSFFSIRDAINILQNYRAKDLAHHKMEVARDGDSIVVLFTYKDRRLGARKGARAEMNNAELETFSSKKDQLEIIDTIEGNNFLAIEAAAEAFQPHDPDLKLYKIEVVRDGNSLLVLFTDKDRPKGARGNIGTHPGFEVALDADNLNVLRSNFIR